MELFDEIPASPPDRWLIDNEGPLSWKAYDADAKIAYQLNDTKYYKCCLPDVAAAANAAL